MSLGKTWYHVSKASEKFGISSEQIQEWIREGLVRSELSDEGKTLANGDDIALQIEGLVSEMHDNGEDPKVSI